MTNSEVISKNLDKSLHKNPILNLRNLIIFNLIWTILSIFADYDWLSKIPVYLIPITAICSLYPLLLLCIYLLIAKKKEVPQFLLWLTSIGLITYGIYAQLYFPLLMTWRGFNFHDFGSMFWVAAYGLQFFIIEPLLKKLPIWQIVLLIGYFTTVNSAHYFYPTFLDFTLQNYPSWLTFITVITVIFMQIYGLAFLIKKTYFTACESSPSSTN